MATLNIAETEALRAAMAKVGAVRRELTNHTETGEGTRQTMIELLKQAEDNIKMVVTMKGHYPK